MIVSTVVLAVLNTDDGTRSVRQQLPVYRVKKRVINNPNKAGLNHQAELTVRAP